MLATVTTKVLRDRWTSPVYAGVGIALLLLLSMAVYSEIDTSFYYELPVVLLEAFGTSADVGGVGGIAYGAMYNLMGAMAVAGIAISIGAEAIAGEEQAGTLDLLLGNPRSRRHVLVANVIALVLLVTLAGLLLWAGGLLVPQLLSVQTGGISVAALSIHVAAGALFWGMLALAIGAVTGRRVTAVGGASAVMVLSWLTASLLPLNASTADFAKVSPWFYFNGSQPELNGIEWGHLAVLASLSVVCGVVGVIGLDRRDLKRGEGTTTLLDWLRNNPRTQDLADKLAGSARVSGIASKTISDRQTLLNACCAIMFYLGLAMGPFYLLLPESFTLALRQAPEALLAANGGIDMSTPSGWLQGQVFATMLPLVGIGMFASLGARALAGEEDNHTMELLLANPVSRTAVIIAKVQAMLVYAVVLGVVTFAATAIGVLLGRLDVSMSGLAAISALGTLLGLAHGGLALLLSAATGRVKVSVYAAAGVGLVGYMVQAFFPLADAFAPFAGLSPFHYFTGGDPLIAGMPWGDAAVLVALFAVLVAGSIPLFNRRDLRG